MNATQTALAIAIATTAPALGDKRYLSDVAAALGFDAERFEAVLLSAWYDGHIELSRADLVLDSAKVEASELRIETETFHYARLAS
jgi:hypothetical protein